MEKYLFVILGSFTLAFFLTPIFKKIAIFFDVLDYPKSPHKSHLIATPYLGGVGIILVVVAGLFILDSFQFEFIRWDLQYLVLPPLILGVVGFLDDISSFSAHIKLVFQTLCSAAAIYQVQKVTQIVQFDSHPVINILISVLFIVFMCNSTNFLDNSDGALSSLTILTCLNISLLAVKNGQIEIALLSLLLLGATAGFLVWNWHPAKIFLGDAGSLFIGFLLGILVLKLEFKELSITHTIFVTFFIVAIFALDTIFVISSRLFRGAPLMIGGLDHLAHVLKKNGFTSSEIVLFYCLVSGNFAGLSILISFASNRISIVLIMIGIIIWTSLFSWFWHKSKYLRM